jgi:cyanophycin synthetase
VPQGSTCDTEEELVEAAEEIGYPVVVKPVSGHKGQGVSTHLQNAEEVVAAFRRIHHGGEDETLVGDGVIIESFVEGGDYRLLAVAGKYVAALHREPPSVTGDGSSTVEELIAAENSRERRRDTIRSPLGRIICDEDLVGYLRQQELDLSSIPDREQRVPLRRIANISAGGVSINVTDELHPDNRALVESIAAFFQVTCLGIDVIAADITRSWKEGQFGIIEINAGPGIFMHLAPAVGNPVDVPGRVMDALFPSSDRARVPLVVGNGLSAGFCQRLRERFQRMDPNVRVATLDGVGEFLIQGQPVTAPLPFHRSLLTLLRHPHTDIAIISHTKDTIFDHGTIHTGADIVVLRNPHYAEKILQRDINPGGILALVDEEAVVLSRDGLEVGRLPLVGVPDWEEVVVAALTPFLPPLVERSRP